VCGFTADDGGRSLGFSEVETALRIEYSVTMAMKPWAPKKFWQQLVLTLITSGALASIFGSVFGLVVGHSAADKKLNSSETRKQIGQIAAEESKGIVGEIRAFAFGGKKDSQAIEALRSSGWLECAGQEIPRQNFPEIYDKLYASGQTTSPWGVVNGRIHAPDLRGVFLRGWDHGAGTDPDAANPQLRVASGSNGESGDRVGSYESDLVGHHSHESFRAKFSMVGPNPSIERYTGFSEDDLGWGNPNTNTSGKVGNVKTAENVGAETRPKNVFVLYCIYLGHPITAADIPHGDEVARNDRRRP
jgi:hypothetical protein